ncbi:MAG: DUF192 domain-containing protein [Verrucomicrobia bacterium]|nr:DUF192 domain-containing protein [Verrucomicrobiota bacterium]
MRLVDGAISMTMVLLALAGCKPSAVTPAAPAVSEAAGYLDHAQPRLRTLKLWLGAQELVTEIARSAVEVQTGMMYRTEMGENEAMLFVFPVPYRAQFYMRNTLLPLSCAYMDSNGVIREIHDMKPKDETSITAATDDIQYVLETRQGWFQRHHIGIGTVVRTERGSFAETFWGGRGDTVP